MGFKIFLQIFKSFVNKYPQKRKQNGNGNTENGNRSLSEILVQFNVIIS